jgi:hypothetical protein
MANLMDKGVRTSRQPNYVLVMNFKVPRSLQNMINEQTKSLNLLEKIKMEA